MAVLDGPVTGLNGSIAGQPGTLLAERYRLGTLIGRGATASVYRARDERLGRDVALKLFTPLLGGPDGIARHETEMRLLATFNHPSLVTLLDAGTDLRDPDHPRTFLTMELIHGPDLHARLQEGPLDPKQVAHIGADLASALEYVHGRGIIHRDIKPANVLLAGTATGPRVRPKLTDFGIARIIESTRLTATGMTVGTAAYLSPEQATGSALGPESDIYSLGLLLLECLTGTLEYPGTSVESAVARLHRPPRVPAAFGPRWIELLSAMTSIQPSGRPTSRDVEAALRAASESGTPSAIPGAAHGPTQALPRVPDRPPRTAKPAVDILDSTATKAGAIEPGGTAVVPPARIPKRRRPIWLSAVLAAGAVLLTTVLVIIGVSALGQSAPAAPSPDPSVPGLLGQHLEQLRKSVTP
ncbi:protein kinase [Arthrobacter sp. NA-172]|uniref:protein kinase domain-containing protein n=1 Tax=Arthrobacter sp. NA-172 TaxID=3367524 RepID=UPI0037545BC7